MRARSTTAYLTPGVVGFRRTPGQHKHELRCGAARATPRSDVTCGWRDGNDGRAELRHHRSSSTKPSRWTRSRVQRCRRTSSARVRADGRRGGMVASPAPTISTGRDSIFCGTRTSTPDGWFQETAPAARGLILPARSDRRRSPAAGEKKDKTFFFATYPVHKTEAPTSQTATFPTLEQHAGDFSKTFQSSSQLIQIFNPF